MDYAAIRAGEVLGRAFGLYRRHFGVLLVTALPIFLVVVVLDQIVGRDEAGPLFFRTALNLAAAALYSGIVVGLVRDVREERPRSSVAANFRSVGPVLGPLIGAGVLYGIGVGIGLFLVVVPGLVLLTWWVAVTPVIVIEGKPMLSSFGRSRELVRGYAWPVFFTILVVNLILVVAVPLLLVAVAVIADHRALEIPFNVVASTLWAPVDALVTAVLYYQLLELKGQAPRPAAPVSAV